MSARRVPGERAYAALLRLYPADFRADVGVEMRAFYRARWREESTRGAAGAVALWVRLLVDVGTTAPLEHLAAARRRRRARLTPSRTPHLPSEPRMPSLLTDLRRAARALARRPALVAVVLATLTLGIGANAAIFSVVHGILLRPLPFRDPAGVMHVTLREPYIQVSEPELIDLRRDVPAFAAVGAWSGGDANLTGGSGEPARVETAQVSDQFFQVLGVAPVAGRTFTGDEERRGGPPAVVVSHRLWRERLGGERAAIGRTLVVDGTPRTVVGVMPPRFDFPRPEVELWTPLYLPSQSLSGRNNHYLQAVARLAPGATRERAALQAATLAARWKRDFPDMYPPDRMLAADVRPIADTIVGGARPYLLALAGAVTFVLLIACVNVANLLLARGEQRRRELALRGALGASGANLARIVLAEGALLAVGGGVLGLAAAWGATRLLRAAAPGAIPRLDEIGLNATVLAFTAVVSVGTGLLAALVPALRAARGAPADALREGGKGTPAGAGARRTRGALVVAEVALAVVTLAGAGLMLRSLWKLQGTELGIATAHILTLRVSPPRDAYDSVRAARLWRELPARVATIPGVRVATAAQNLPIANEDDSRWSIFTDGRVVANVSDAAAAKPVHVTPDFFRAFGIPVVRGRALTARDDASAPAVVVVNETMARQLWPGRDPLGHTMRVMGDSSAAWARVVGVARDVRSGGFRGEVPPTFYVPHAQGDRSAYYVPRAMTLVVRTSGEPMAVAGAVRAAVRAAAPDAPITAVRTMDDVVASSIASRRFGTGLLAGFAALALVLAAIGIYGVVAYAVSQRTFEIGLRMALGATRGSVLALVLRTGVRLAALGLLLGTAGALASGRLLRSLLVDVSAIDPATYAAVAIGLLVVALTASALPARRAMSVEAATALRSE